MEYEFNDFLGRLERLVEGKGTVSKTTPPHDAGAENCIYLFLPDNPELQAIVKKEIKSYLFREELLNGLKMDFVVAECYRCNDFECTGHHDNPDDESEHCFRNRFPEDINGTYILFRGD